MKRSKILFENREQRTHYEGKEIGIISSVNPKLCPVLFMYIRPTDVLSKRAPEKSKLYILFLNKSQILKYLESYNSITLNSIKKETDYNVSISSIHKAIIALIFLLR